LTALKQSPLIELENVTISIPSSNTRRILASNLNLRLEPDSIIPIIGPSGCGKSTLLRTIIKLSPLTSGNIRFYGKPIETLPVMDVRARCIYLHQHPVIFPGTVSTNLIMPFTFKAVKRKAPERSELLKILERVGLSAEMLDLGAVSLSGGEAQRLALARAMLIEPQLLLLDEPTASLDGDSATTVINVIKAWVTEGGRGVIWVVHEAEIIRNLGVKPLRMTPKGFVE